MRRRQQSCSPPRQLRSGQASRVSASARWTTALPWRSSRDRLVGLGDCSSSGARVSVLIVDAPALSANAEAGSRTKASLRRLRAAARQARAKTHCPRSATCQGDGDAVGAAHVLGRSTELHPWRGLLAQRVDVPRARHALELVLAPVGELHARAYDELLDVEETTTSPGPRARRRERRWGRPGPRSCPIASRSPVWTPAAARCPAP